MQDKAEAVLAILNVLLGIQDMELPELINQFGGHDERMGILPMFKAQNQETAILLRHPTGKIQGPAVAFFPVHGLDENRLQIQTLF